MHATSLKCFFCEREYKLERRYGCDACGGSLEVQYELDENPFIAAFQNPDRGIWKFRKLLPIHPDTEPVSMGEGATPLFKATRLGSHLGVEGLYLKNETLNPTLAFKDRAMSVAVTKAKELGVSRIIAASTGNTAVSVSAYAARADLPCRVYVPAGTPEQKVALVRRFGAEIQKIEGDFGEAYRHALRAGEEDGAFNVTTTFLNPYVGEGYKTLAYELYDDLGRVPDWIIIPAGAGPFLAYCAVGFAELRKAGLVKNVPKLVAVQAEGCAPIARAFAKELDEVEPWGDPDTVAGAVADPLTSYPRDGTRTLRIVRASKGCALSIPDEDTLRHVDLLTRLEGLFVEPAAALATAVVEKLKVDGQIQPGQTVVSVITGHGLKTM